MKQKEKWAITLSLTVEEDENKEIQSFRTLSSILEQDEDEDNEFTFHTFEETIAYLENTESPTFLRQNR